MITFQQGVVDYTLDVPIKLLSSWLSARPLLLSWLNQTEDSLMPLDRRSRPVEYFNAGSLFDVLVPLPDQFSLQTVLLIDSIQFRETPGEPREKCKRYCS